MQRRRLATLGILLGAISAAFAFALFRQRASPTAEAASAGYETHDADAGSLFAALAIFAVGIAVSIGLMIALLGHWHAADAAQSAGFTQIQRTSTPPPAPRLQADPDADLARLQDREAAAQIPIQSAMARLVGRPLGPAGDSPR